MKKLLLVLVIFSSTSAYADLRCTDQSIANCNARVKNVLAQLDCQAVESSIKCQYDQEIDDDGNPTKKSIYCSFEALKCDEPKPDLFFTTHCQSGGQKKSISKYDRFLTLDYSMGFGPFVTKLCKYP